MSGRVLGLANEAEDQKLFVLVQSSTRPPLQLVCLQYGWWKLIEGAFQRPRSAQSLMASSHVADTDQLLAVHKYSVCG